MEGLRRILKDYPETPTTRWLEAYVESYDQWKPVNHMLEQLDKMTLSVESFIDPRNYRATYENASHGSCAITRGWRE